MADHGQGFENSAYTSASANLPPGWDCKYDARSGRFYYINYFTKTTTWEDPRLRYRPVASPPTQYYNAINAGEIIPLQELTNIRPSPIPSRAYSGQGTVTTISTSPSRTPAPSVADSTTINDNPIISETELAVTKIGAMFPTASEIHIRTLLKKYHNREAVVISALQVEKYPLTTPGPAYTTPPSMNRQISSSGLPFGLYSAYQQLISANSLPKRRCSPPRSPTQIIRLGSGTSSSGGETFNSSRPHSSPKMKLRYMKSVFPSVDETLLLDILSNADSNVQKATERLLAMGFEKRETPPPRLAQRRKEEEQHAKEKQNLANVTPTPPPRMKSLEEKQKIKKRLQSQYPDIPERVVTIALDSSDFDEERAAHILLVMVQEETSKPSSLEDSAPITKSIMTQDVKCQVTDPCLINGKFPSQKGSPAKKTEKDVTQTHRKPRGKKEVSKVSRGTSTTEDKEYKSPFLQTTVGPNSDLQTGPNDKLLLVDYVTWNGPNCELRGGPRKSLAKGPNPKLREQRTTLAKGPNKSFANGPMKGLAKGSVYTTLSQCKSETHPEIQSNIQENSNIVSAQ